MSKDDYRHAGRNAALRHELGRRERPASKLDVVKFTDKLVIRPIARTDVQYRRIQVRRRGIACTGIDSNAITIDPHNISRRIPVIDKCIAWNRSVHATSSDDSPHYSSGAVVGFTSVKNYLSNCYRRADLDFQECNSAQFNVLYDQENASPAAPLVIAVKGDYNYPYHGKAAPSGATLSSVARSLGWPEDIWDFSGAIPVHRDVKTDVPEESESTGQLPDFFEENEIYK